MTPERVQIIYDEIESLVIELDSNPSAKGPAYLQDLIARTRGYLNQVAHYIHEVHREKHRLDTMLEAQEAAFAIASDELLSSDNRVSKLPNIEDRRSMINLLLSSDRKLISDLKREAKNLGHVDKAVRHRHKELESTMAAIRLQRSLLESELRTGSYYGDETDSSRGNWGSKKSTPLPIDMGIDETELGRLMEQASLTIEPGSLDSLVEESSTVAVLEASEIKATPKDEFSKFLEGDDYSDIFSQI